MIQVLAIDDEPLALKQLTTYIGKIPFFNLAGACQSALEAKELIDKENIDAIFCDINMPDLNGMDFVKGLSAPPIIVFTTAYSEYAIDGYKVDAVDYLLKPYGLDDFKHAANKVQKVYDALNPLPSAPPTLKDMGKEAIAEDSNDPDSLFVKTEHRIVKITISKITYIEGMSEYLKIHIEDEKSVVVLLNMKKMLERLPNYFMRIHRSYIINLKRIQEVNKNRVILDAETYLPIGDMYREDFTKYLDSKFLGK